MSPSSTVAPFAANVPHELPPDDDDDITIELPVPTVRCVAPSPLGDDESSATEVLIVDLTHDLVETPTEDPTDDPTVEASEDETDDVLSLGETDEVLSLGEPDDALSVDMADALSEDVTDDPIPANDVEAPRPQTEAAEGIPSSVPDAALSEPEARSSGAPDAAPATLEPLAAHQRGQLRPRLIVFGICLASFVAGGLLAILTLAT